MAEWTEELMEKVKADAVKALTRTAIACTNDLKQIVSTPAPRKVSKKTGRVYAATKATPGAPPRKLTGRGRTSLAYKVAKDALEASVGTNVIYMRKHEKNADGSAGLHQYVEPVMTQNRAKYEKLLGGG